MPPASCASSTRRFCGTRRSRICRESSTSRLRRCTENCTHAETQDLVADAGDQDHRGRRGQGLQHRRRRKDRIWRAAARHRRSACSAAPEDAAALCSHITLLFRDYGPRRARNRARLAFLVEEWGIDKFRRELERRVGERLLPQGRDARTSRHHDHLGISRQKQPGLCSVGLNVPVGRITADQLSGLARIARRYGNGRRADYDEPERHRPERAGTRSAADDQRAASARASSRPDRHDARPRQLHRHRLLPHGAHRNEGAGHEDRARARRSGWVRARSC